MKSAFVDDIAGIFDPFLRFSPVFCPCYPGESAPQTGSHRACLLSQPVLVFARLYGFDAAPRTCPVFAGIGLCLCVAKPSRKLDPLDPNFRPVVEGRPLMIRTPAGDVSPWRVAADGIALSADGQTLYFSPLSSRHLFSVPTRLLRDHDVSEATLSAAVIDLGEKGASDGLEADADGAIYAGDYEHNGIRRRLPDGRWETLAPTISRILWPDSLSIGPDGYLYFTANQLHRQADYNGGRDLRKKPYSLIRVRIDAAPAPTR